MMVESRYSALHRSLRTNQPIVGYIHSVTSYWLRKDLAWNAPISATAKCWVCDSWHFFLRLFGCVIPVTLKYLVRHLNIATILTQLTCLSLRTASNRLSVLLSRTHTQNSSPHRRITSTFILVVRIFFSSVFSLAPNNRSFRWLVLSVLFIIFTTSQICRAQ